MGSLKVITNIVLIVGITISIIAVNNRLTNTEHALNHKILNLKDREAMIISIITQALENEKLNYQDLDSRLKALENKKPVIRR